MLLVRYRHLVASALVACRTVLALPTIEIKGSKFFTSDGDQFYVKGVAYQPGGPTSGITSSLTNGDQCRIDAKLIADLGANVIRVYSVDPTLNHDECMKAFGDLGIYVIVDMATPQFSINRNDPTWTKALRDAFAQVIDGFQQYDNVLAFFAGNEIINDGSTSAVAPYAKAVVADMKAYRDLMQYRKIPIGYSAADISENRVQTQNYFDCGDEATAVDFYAFNNYVWCGDSSMEESGYDKLYEYADGYDIPIFLSETGCNNGTGDEPFRSFTDQVAMLGRDMNDRYSGNIIYEWSEEGNFYGLASYPDSSPTGTPSLRDDYSRLSSQWATLTPAGVKASAYDPTLTRRDCPAFTSSVWLVQKDAEIPTLGTSGFTAPTGVRSTATATGTRSGAGASAAAETSGASNASLGPEDSSSNGSSKTPVGAIAGGVLGGLVVLALILGAVLFFLQRKKKQRATMAIGEEREGGQSDKMVVDPQEEKDRQNGYYGPSYPEMSGYGTTQELDPARGHVAPMPANELEQQYFDHELAGANGQGGREITPPEGYEEPVRDHGGIPAQQAEPSPYVQAQRRLEIDWLESEEQRMRQRRELLARQGDEGGL